MNCLKCAGILVEERVQDYFLPFTVWRCLLCGAALDSQIYRNRLTSQAKGIQMPKFLSEESKAAWVEKVRRSKAAKKQRENDALQQDEDGENLPVVTETVEAETIAQSTGPSSIHRRAGLAAIDQVLAEFERDRAILEQAREILSR